MGNGAGLALSLACGLLLGFGAAQLFGGSKGTDPALQAQMSALSQRLGELDQRLSARGAAAAASLDEEQLLGILRTALAERDAAAPRQDCSVASREAGRAPASLSRAQRAQLESMMQGNADPDDMMPVVREVVESLK